MYNHNFNLIGNKLCSGNKKVLDRMHKNDLEFMKRESWNQINRGAKYVELNAEGLLQDELPFLKKAVNYLEAEGINLMVFSSNLEVLLEIALISRREILLGDIPFDKTFLKKFLPIIREKNIKIISAVSAENTNFNDIPETSLLIAQSFLDFLLDNNIKRENILLKPPIQNLENNYQAAKIFLSTLELFKLDFPNIMTIADLGFITDGLPKKSIISSYLTSIAISRGLDYIITNVLDSDIKECIVTTLSIIGKDHNLQNYYRFFRNHRSPLKEELSGSVSNNERRKDKTASY